MKQQVNVISANSVVRLGVGAMLQGLGKYETCSEFNSVNDADAALKSQRGTVNIVDLSGSSRTRQNTKLSHRLIRLIENHHVLALCDLNDMDMAIALADAGCAGLLTAEVESSELDEALTRILRGRSFIGQSLTTKLLFSRRQQQEREMCKSELGLSVREQQVANRIKSGLSNPLIADELGISERTVKHYVSTLKDKLNAVNRTQIAVFLQRIEPI
jgi:DNA-binding NarL/FixJ family response regulator